MVKVLEKEAPQREVTREQNLVQVIPRNLVLKGGKCHYSDVFQSLVSPILIVIEYQGINLDTIQQMVDEKKIKDAFDFDMMMAHRLAGKNDLVKILGRGELKSKLTVTAHKFTASAKAAIEAAGGEAVTL